MFDQFKMTSSNKRWSSKVALSNVQNAAKRLYGIMMGDYKAGIIFKKLAVYNAGQLTAGVSSDTQCCPS